MARKSVTRDIDGLDVTVTQFAVSRTLPLLATLMQVAGPAIGKLAPMLGGGMAGLGKTQVDALAPALVALAGGLAEVQAAKLLADLLGGTIVVATDDNGKLVKHDLSGGTGAIDRAFDGRLMTVFKVAAFALEVNYGDFFGGTGLPAEEAATA